MILRRVGMKRILVSIFLLVGVTTSGTFAQSNPPGFQDDLLDRLVGKWNATGAVHGTPSKQTFEVDWALNHQFLRIHEKSEENVRGANVPVRGCDVYRIRQGQ
jgi:hypothetical protein